MIVTHFTPSGSADAHSTVAESTPALQRGHSQGRWLTVEGSNPGLVSEGTPRSYRELRH
jgi:hypothetical protein